jgi:hypothetical protein
MLTGVEFYKQESYIGMDIRDGSGARIATPAVNITDSVEWQQFSVTFTVPINAASMVVFVYLEARGITTNYVLTDDWALVSGWTPLPFEIPTGVVNSNSFNSVKLYPNPLADQLLNIEGAVGGESFIIFDLTGRMIFSQKLQNSEKQTIDLSNKVQKGSYLVKITGKTGTNSQLLIVE